MNRVAYGLAVLLLSLAVTPLSAQRGQRRQFGQAPPSPVQMVLDGADVIAAPHLESALAIWSYAEASARHIFGDSTGEPLADEIRRVLLARPEGMTRSEIRDHFLRNRRADSIGRALSLLREHGLARVEVEQTGGRPAERWFAVTGYAINDLNDQR